MKVIDLCQWCRFHMLSTESGWNVTNWEKPLIVVTKYGWWTAQVFERSMANWPEEHLRSGRSTRKCHGVQPRVAIAKCSKARHRIVWQSLASALCSRAEVSLSNARAARR